MMICLSLLLSFFCQAAVVTKINDILLDSIRESHLGPPMVARALAIVHTSMYDAWAAYDSNAIGTQLGTSMRQPSSELTSSNKEKAIICAAAASMQDLFSNAHSWQQRMNQLLANVQDSIPCRVGLATTQALLNFRHNDGANQLGNYVDYTGYQAINTPDLVRDINRWQPLRVKGVVQTYIAPHWGLVIPFALNSSSQFRPRPPALYGSQEFMQQTIEIINLTSSLNDQQKVMAEYWADGPRSALPPGHWCLLSTMRSQKYNLTLDDEVKLFFAVTNAVFDAGIVAWEAKRYYDSVRPITAIRTLFKGNTILSWGKKLGKEVKGEDWVPYQSDAVVTPPFPEYISGHSSFSAAAAEVIHSFFGSNSLEASFTQKAHTATLVEPFVPSRDITLTWKTLSDASMEAALSRRYGGIHFQAGDYEGRYAGRKTGRVVWRKCLTYWNAPFVPVTERK